MRWFAIVACVIVMSAVVTHVHAQADNAGYSLTLTAAPAGSEVPRGATITYTIHHSLPRTDPVYVTYRMITPLGTTFVSARAVSGATVSAEAVPPAAAGTSPVGQQGVFVDASPTALDGSIIVTVRVEDTWQGPITAQAFFVGTGFGQGSTISQSVALGDGVPGQLVAHRFIDLNGNRVLDPEDFPMSCGVYVYTPRSPRDAFRTTLPTPRTRVSPWSPSARQMTRARRVSTCYPAATPCTSLAVRRARRRPACTSATNVIADPPLTSVLSASGASKYDVQLIDVATTQLTDLVYAEQPAGPLAPPTDLRRDGLTLTWTDNADGEVAYRVVVQSTAGGAGGTFDLPANSMSFLIPSSLLVACGHTSLQNPGLAR